MHHLQLLSNAGQLEIWSVQPSLPAPQSRWRPLLSCPSLFTSLCDAPAPCRGRASPAPVVSGGGLPSWGWWRATSWWTSRVETCPSTCSSRRTDCGYTGRTVVVQAQPTLTAHTFTAPLTQINQKLLQEVSISKWYIYNLYLES